MPQNKSGKLLLMAAALLLAGFGAQQFWRGRDGAASAQATPPAQAVPVRVATAQRGDIDHVRQKLLGCAAPLPAASMCCILLNEPALREPT